MVELKDMIRDIGMAVEHSKADLHEMVQREEYTPSTIECMKNIAKLAYYYQVLQAMGESEYSGNDYSQGWSNESSNRSHRSGRSYESYDGSYDDSYDSQMSGRRGRNAMGRYTSRDSGRYSENRSLINSLDALKHQTSNDKERDAIERLVEQLEKM